MSSVSTGCVEQLSSQGVRADPLGPLKATEARAATRPSAIGIAAAYFLHVFEHRGLVLGSPLEFSFSHEELLWIRDPHRHQRPCRVHLELGPPDQLCRRGDLAADDGRIGAIE